ncbi:MAG: cyclic nucleotide-binding domain-containing protein, partial [Gemmatimonadales bacterium]
MTAPVATQTLIPAAEPDQTFPKLTPAQIARVAERGRLRQVEHGEVLWAAGKPIPLFFVVRSGTIEVVQIGEKAETTVTVMGPGEFTGEVSMLAGRPSLVTLRVGEAGEVIETERDALLELVQTDAELSEIFVRAFLLRRARLIAGKWGDVVLVGSNHSSDTLRIKEFLTRNVHPYSSLDPDSDPGVQDLLDRFK